MFWPIIGHKLEFWGPYGEYEVILEGLTIECNGKNDKPICKGNRVMTAFGGVLKDREVVMGNLKVLRLIKNNMSDVKEAKWFLGILLEAAKKGMFLEEICFNGNKIENVNIIKMILGLVKKCSNLQSVTIAENDLSEIDIDWIIDALKNLKLKELNISNNKIDNKGRRRLIKVLLEKIGDHLVLLNIGGGYVEEYIDGVTNYFRWLGYSVGGRKLKELNIGGLCQVVNDIKEFLLGLENSGSHSLETLNIVSKDAIVDANKIQEIEEIINNFVGRYNGKIKIRYITTLPPIESNSDNNNNNGGGGGSACCNIL